MMIDNATIFGGLIAFIGIGYSIAFYIIGSIKEEIRKGRDE